MAKINQEIALESFREIVLDANERDQQAIIDYVEWQSNKGKKTKKVVVRHLELVKAEVVFDTEHEAWDVHTNEKDGRWWVITSPTNLYSQKEFPSLDYTLSFHVGLMARMAAMQSKTAPDDSRGRFIKVWRRWESAAKAFETAKESENFQAIGVVCREALIELTKGLQVEIVLDTKAVRPKSSDFCQWVPLVVEKYASGDRNSYVRALLKNTATQTWQVVNWVTHTTSASKYEASLALDATQSFINLLSKVVIHYESGGVDACPNCHSYKVSTVFESDMGLEPPYYNLCETCGWNNIQDRYQEG